MLIVINMIWMQSKVFLHEKLRFRVCRKMIRYGTQYSCNYMNLFNPTEFCFYRNFLMN